MTTFPGRMEARITVPTGGWGFSASLGSMASPVILTIPAANYQYTAAGGISSILTTMQNLLNDNVQGYPQTAQAMQAAVGYGPWNAGWLFNIASGNDSGVFGGVTMTASSTPTYGMQGPAGATTSTIDKAVGFDSAADAFTAGDNFDVNVGDDLIFAWVAKFTAAQTSATLLTKRNAGSGYAIFATASGFQFNTYDGTSRDAVTGAAGQCVGEWHVGIAVIDRGAGVIRVGTRGLTSGTTTVGATVSIAGMATLANADPFTLCGSGFTGTAPLGSFVAAAYVSAGAGVGAGLSANLSLALTGFANAVNAAWTVTQDQTNTGRITISNSGWPAYVQFTSTSLRDVFGYAYDFDYPQTAAQMATAFGYGTWTNGIGYLCNETSGNLASVFGTPASLTASFTPLYSILGPRGGVDKAVGLDSNSDAFFGGASDLDVNATEDLLFVWAAYLTTDLAIGTTNLLFSKNGGAGVQWRVYMYRNSGSSCGIAMQLSDGVDNLFPVTDNASAALNIRGWHVGAVVLERATKKARVATYNLQTNTLTLGTELDATAIDSLANGGVFTVGNGESQPWYLGAFYAVKGVGVATGVSANLGTAVTNFANYMKSQVTTQSARGIWIPDSLLTVKGDPRRAPLKTDKRESRGPTGYVFSIIGNSFPRHLGLMWDMVTIDRVWDAESTNENGTWEEFVKETQFGMGLSCFPPCSPVQIYDHNNVQVGIDGAVAGWYLLGLDSIEPEKVDPQYTGLWRIQIPEISAVGS